MIEKVIIAGAGIGSRKNLTLAVQEALEEADILVFDRLLNPELIQTYGKDKEVYYVGKKSGDHALPQDEINQLLVDQAKKGKKVVRLKGGDPYIFGRGSEEALYLKENGVPFEVLPGVTSGVVAPACAGIPATHRDLVTSVSFITGHRKKGVVGNFHEYAQLEGSLVFYMGVKNLPKIVGDLLEGGIDPKRPVAIIENGGYNNQRTITGQVENIVQIAEKEAIGSPALIIISETIGLRKDLNFFEDRPLFGKHVLITRALSQSRGLADQLEKEGALVHNLPTLDIQPKNEDLLLEKLEEKTYDYILFMSANAVDIFFKNYLKDHDIRDLYGSKIAVIGKKTQEVLETYHLRADLCPKVYVGEAFIDLLSHHLKPQDQVLLPHSQISRPHIVQGIKDLAQVDEIIIYENHLPKDPAPLPEKRDYILFTSSSTVNHYLDLYGKESLDQVDILSIGDITSQTLLSHGLTVSKQSQEASIDSLVEALKELVQDEHKNEKN
ncbi:MAG: uroporphyrinogen-III C-methyltransferase [Tissierellia bacterium]|nr:uroporphyrinogen-III C-methyltransferase [Tissierellia bacterium]